MRVYIDLAAFFVGMYNRNENDLDFLVESVVPKTVLTIVYKDFIDNELILPVELLQKTEKEKLVEKCMSTGIKFNNEKLKNAAEILHTINFINNNS